jgi:hypothetical protein
MQRGREGGGGEDGGSDTEAKVAGTIRFTGLELLLRQPRR